MNTRDSGLGTLDSQKRRVPSGFSGIGHIRFRGRRSQKTGDGLRWPSSPESRVPSPEHQVPSPARQTGFTLIEVMAAFAIFAVLFGIVLQILSTSISNTRRSGDFTQAALLAQSQLDMVGIQSLPEPGHYSGRYNDDYSWEMVVEPYFIEDDRGVMYDELPIDLYYVGLTVYWGEGAGERSVLFETLRSVDRFYAERQEQGR